MDNKVKDQQKLDADLLKATLDNLVDGCAGFPSFGKN